MLSDEALYEKLAGGDLSAFDALYARYERPVFGFLVRTIGDRAAAEDLLQQVFVALVREKKSPRMVHSFKAFVFQIARNLCLNRARSGRREERALAAEASVPEEAAPPPEAILEGHERRARLLAAVKRLPEALSELYELRTRGLSYEEISSLLGIPVGTVKSRMNQMVNTLKEELAR